MADLPDSARIASKGLTLLSALAYVDSRHGPAGRERLLAALDEADRAVVGGRLLAGDWYPFRIQVGLYETIDRLWGAGDLALCWEVGKFTAEHEASTINKVFLKLARLETWLRVAGTMWGRYYNAGALELGEFADGTGEVRVRDFNPISKAFCYDFGGWLWRTAQMSGLAGVSVQHDDCLLDGAPACVWRARWR